MKTAHGVAVTMWCQVQGTYTYDDVMGGNPASSSSGRVRQDVSLSNLNCRTQVGGIVIRPPRPQYPAQRFSLYRRLYLLGCVSGVDSGFLEFIATKFQREFFAVLRLQTEVGFPVRQRVQRGAVRMITYR